MPIGTTLQRNGELVPLRWGSWHLDCLFTLACHEVLGIPIDDVATGCDPDHQVRYFPDEYTYSTSAVFVDPADGEVFGILPGDTFRCER